MDIYSENSKTPFFSLFGTRFHFIAEAGLEFTATPLPPPRSARITDVYHHNCLQNSFLSRFYNLREQDRGTAPRLKETFFLRCKVCFVCGKERIQPVR